MLGRDGSHQTLSPGSLRLPTIATVHCLSYHEGLSFSVKYIDPLVDSTIHRYRGLASLVGSDDDGRTFGEMDAGGSGASVGIAGLEGL
jgi:hypothetical protein